MGPTRNHLIPILQHLLRPFSRSKKLGRIAYWTRSNNYQNNNNRSNKTTSSDSPFDFTTEDDLLNPDDENSFRLVDGKPIPKPKFGPKWRFQNNNRNLNQRRPLQPRQMRSTRNHLIPILQHLLRLLLSLRKLGRIADWTRSNNYQNNNNRSNKTTSSDAPFDFITNDDLLNPGDENSFRLVDGFLINDVPFNPDGWGPPETTSSQSFNISFAPFSRSEKLGRITDWTGSNNYQNNNNRSNKTTSPNSPFDFTTDDDLLNPDDENSFRLVDGEPSEAKEGEVHV
nr:eukaryotic translation initiation factor 3 subunit D-like [Tanacetum cinerariifolium]